LNQLVAYGNANTIRHRVDGVEYNTEFRKEEFAILG